MMASQTSTTIVVQSEGIAEPFDGACDVQHRHSQPSNGSSSQSSTSKQSHLPQHRDMHGNVFEVPDFTMKQIYDAIPAHCFQPSLVKSLSYAVRDYFYLGSLMYVAYNYVPMLPSVWLRGAAYALYTVAAGMVMTGIWIIAHECGHGAFSKNKRLNDTIGFILHSFLLVPYFSWKITHSHHHKATGDMQRDTVFVPHDRESWVKKNVSHDADPLTVESVSEDAPLRILWQCLLHQLFAWPLYMVDNLGGQAGQRGFPYYSHYWFGEDSAIFKKSELKSVFLSDAGVMIMAAVLHQVALRVSWSTVFIFYGVPYLWLNHWVVLITFLQHTDGRLPHFAHSQWTFARGAAATIDRDFGFIDTHVFHHIVGTHVLHHLVSSIPFYHAQEATQAIKKVMGKHYHEDRETSILTAFWRNQRDCQFVEESEGMEGSGVFMFRNLHGRGVRKSLQKSSGERVGHTPDASRVAVTSGGDSVCPP